MAIISVLIAVGSVLLLAEIALRFLPVNDGIRRVPAVTRAEPILHFSPDRRFVYSQGWNFENVNRGRINNAGFVNDQDYVKDDKTPLLAVIGDSYIEALMVPFPETLSGRLQEALKGRARVYSFAASGAPLSQYLIWASHAVMKYGASALVFNVVGNDFDESHAHYSNAPGFWIYAPQVDDRLNLELSEFRPSLLRTLAQQSASARYLAYNLQVRNIDIAMWREWFRTPNPSGEDTQPQYAGNTVVVADPARLAASLAVIDAFLRDLPSYTGLPPDRIVFTLDGSRYPRAIATGSYFDRMRRAFIERATVQGYETIDLDRAFFANYQQKSQRFEFPRDGHWNALGHGVVAEAVLRSSMLQKYLAP